MLDFFFRGLFLSQLLREKKKKSLQAETCQLLGVTRRKSRFSFVKNRNERSQEMDIRALHFRGPAIAQGAQGGRAESQEGAACIKAPLKPAFGGSQTGTSSPH